MPAPPWTVFVSYSRESSRQRQNIASLVNQLEDALAPKGGTVVFDENETPTDWHKWAEEEVLKATYVIVALSADYKKKWDNSASQRSFGVAREANLIKQRIDSEIESGIRLAPENLVVVYFSDELDEVLAKSMMPILIPGKNRRELPAKISEVIDLLKPPSVNSAPNKLEVLRKKLQALSSEDVSGLVLLAVAGDAVPPSFIRRLLNWPGSTFAEWLIQVDGILSVYPTAGSEPRYHLLSSCAKHIVQERKRKEIVAMHARLANHISDGRKTTDSFMREYAMLYGVKHMLEGEHPEMAVGWISELEYMKAKIYARGYETLLNEVNDTLKRYPARSMRTIKWFLECGIIRLAFTSGWVDYIVRGLLVVVWGLLVVAVVWSSRCFSR